MTSRHDDDPPLAGISTLTIAALATLWLFWSLRAGPVPALAWALVAVIWICGSVLLLADRGAISRV